MSFNEGEFVFGHEKKVALVLKVEKHVPPIPGVMSDLSRYLLEFADGSTLANAPGYLYRDATEDEVVVAIQEARKVWEQAAAEHKAKWT